MNYSFWADEAYIAGIAKQWITGLLSFQDAITTPGITYQRLHMLLVGISFKFFGFSEFAARLPSIFAFTIGVVAIYKLGRKTMNIQGTLLTTFLYSFSHLNLAYATQVKPYSALVTIMFVLLLLIRKLENERRKKLIITYHICIIFTLNIASSLHTMGVLMWCLYFAVLLQVMLNSKIHTNKIFLISLACIAISVYLVIFPIILTFMPKELFPYNNWYQVLKLFSYKYSIITVTAIFGLIWTLYDKRRLNYGVILYIFCILYFAIFQQYSFNIRYVLVTINLLFLYFGIFWSKVGEKYDSKLKFSIFNLKFGGKTIIPLTVLVLLYATGYKIVRWPQAYYNPNIDKYGDVQIANYKDIFRYLKTHKNNNRYGLFNDIADAQVWYFSEHLPDATFVKPSWNNIGYGNTAINPISKKPVYTTLNQFRTEIKKFKKGYIIVEDWESFLPEDVKEYIKKNLKLEYRVESLKEAPNDPWPLALYSWGL